MVCCLGICSGVGVPNRSRGFFDAVDTDACDSCDDLDSDSCDDLDSVIDSDIDVF